MKVTRHDYIKQNQKDVCHVCSCMLNLGAKWAQKLKKTIKDIELEDTDGVFHQDWQLPNKFTDI